MVAYCDCILDGLQAEMTHQELGEKEALAVSRAKERGGTVGESFSADPVIVAVTERCGAAHKE